MQALKKIMLLLGIGTTLLTGVGAAADGVDLVFDFRGEAGMNGWQKTAQMAIAPQPDSLMLNGNGWDAKIYRQVNLPSGYYLVTACGKGPSIQVQLTRNWKENVLDLNLSRQDWRTDWRQFRLEQGGNYMLVVRASGGKPVTAQIKSIHIEAVRETVEPDIPTVTELEKQHPEPRMARGCTLPRAADFPALGALHANLVRKWISYSDGVIKDGPAWEKEMQKLEQYLQAARAEKFKVVLVINPSAFGRTGKGENFWEQPDLADRMSQVWQTLAKRLLPYRDVIYGYDLCNEPLDWSQMPNPPRQWREIAKKVIKAIREIDRETWIVYETGPGGLTWGFGGMKPLPDARVIYSVHFYSPHEFTHQGVMNIKGTDLAEAKAKLNVRYPGVVNGLYWDKEQIKKELDSARQFQLKYHVPMMVCEFSVARWAPREDAVRYLADLISIFEEYQWPWIYHGFRECHVWSVEHDEEFGRVEVTPPPAAYETERAKVLKAGLAKNLERSSPEGSTR